MLVSLYPVDDRATSLLMDRFYRNLTEGGMPPARALREAKVHLRDLHDGSGGRPYEHPAFWSGVGLVGAR